MPSPDPNSRHLTALRHAAGLTQVEWARLLGVHPITVANWETPNPVHHHPPSMQAYIAGQLIGLWLACASGYQGGTWRCSCGPDPDSPHGAGCPAGLLERGSLKLTPGAHPRELVEVLMDVKPSRPAKPTKTKKGKV